MNMVYVAILMAVCAVGCSYLNQKLGVDDDWWGEQIIEDVIEDETGISVDLTPNSPESKE